MDGQVRKQYNYINPGWSTSEELQMVEIPDALRCMFSSPVEAHDEDFIVKVPRDEVEAGNVDPGEIYRVTLLQQLAAKTDSDSAVQPPRSMDQDHTNGPPVEEGEIRSVTIETTGDQGDGLAKVARGYVVIVPDATPGQEPTVKIEHVRENVAFVSVLKDGSSHS